MANIDMKKLDVAIKYIDNIANGYNPSTNTPLEHNSVLNNTNVIRCMFFVKEVLQEVQRNNGVIGKNKKEEPQLPFTYEVLKNYKYSDDVTITKVVAQINGLVKDNNIKKIQIRPITKFLKDNGFLIEDKTDEKTLTRVTKKGEELGLYNTYRKSNINGMEYLAVMYNKQAQEFIVDNLEMIMNN